MDNTLDSGDCSRPAAIIRPIGEGDSLESLTAMLHRAFSRLGAAGLNCTCVDQPPAVTRERIARGACFVAISGSRVIGTISVYGSDPRSSCVRYRRETAASVHQLAVDPEFQDLGIGTRLLQTAETWAREHGYRELALDTPQPACHLVKFYEHHGYRRVETVGFYGKVYRSVVMSKQVAGRRTQTYSRPRTATPAQRVTLHLTVDPSMAARLRSAAARICGEALEFLRIEPAASLPKVECHLCLKSAGFESASDAIIRTMTAAHAGRPA